MVIEEVSKSDSYKLDNAVFEFSKVENSVLVISDIPQN